MNRVVIGLGSNIDPKTNIHKAQQALKSKFTILAQSAFIQTAPIGYTDQDDFINGAILIETELTQEELTQALKQMEIQLGRTKSPIKSGPRSIDLDIVVWNDTIVDQDFYERDFLKNSVLELLPNLEY